MPDWPVRHGSRRRASPQRPAASASALGEGLNVRARPPITSRSRSFGLHNKKLSVQPRARDHRRVRTGIPHASSRQRAAAAALRARGSDSSSATCPRPWPPRSDVLNRLRTAGPVTPSSNTNFYPIRLVVAQRFASMAAPGFIDQFKATRVPSATAASAAASGRRRPHARFDGRATVESVLVVMRAWFKCLRKIR